MRRTASDALGTYSGEAVIRNLIPMLADEVDIISVEAKNNLLDQRNKNLLSSILSDTIESTTDQRLITKIRELQEELATDIKKLR
jgi:hypothetical protein